MSQGKGDGVTLSIYLRRTGKDIVPVAIRVFESIHYDRIHRVQKRASQLVVCGIKEINMWPRKILLKFGLVETCFSPVCKGG